MKKTMSLGIVLLSGLLPACVTTPHGSVQPVVLMNSDVQVTPDSEYLRGKLLHLQARYDEAQQAYLSALTMDKNHVESRNGLAAIQGARGDLDRSIALLSSMVQSDTRLPQVYVNLGYAWMKKGQLVQARAALERALELDPDNAAAQEKMAALLSLMKPLSVQPTPSIATDGSSVPVIAVNSVERLSDGLYVLRYSAPLSVPLPRPAQIRGDVNMSGVIKNVIESSVEITTASTTNEVFKGDEIQEKVPIMAIELANGNGVQGLARSLRGLLDGQIWHVTRTVNHEQFGVRFTRIEYVSGMAQDAKYLADSLGIDVRFRLNNQQTGTQIRIILGHDLKDLRTIRHRLALIPETTRAPDTAGINSVRYRSMN
jgi:hypothetical protein